MADYALKRQVFITKTGPNGVTFTDAIYYTEDEFAAKSEADIQAEVDARFDAWVDATKPVVDTRTPEEVLQDEVAAYAEAKTQAQAQLDNINETLTKKQDDLGKL